VKTPITRKIIFLKFRSKLGDCARDWLVSYDKFSHVSKPQKMNFVLPFLKWFLCNYIDINV
jgi:hypothetical protein